MHACVYARACVLVCDRSHTKAAPTVKQVEASKETEGVTK